MLDGSMSAEGLRAGRYSRWGLTPRLSSGRSPPGSGLAGLLSRRRSPITLPNSPAESTEMLAENTVSATLIVSERMPTRRQGW